MEPLEFSFELSEFSLDLLPIDKALLKGNPELLREAIKTYFNDYFQKLGGEVTIIADPKYVRIAWLPAASNDIEKLLDVAITLLRQGAYKEAEPILESLSNRFPENAMVHFNHGMMLSDQGLLEEAVRHLSTAVTLSPRHADAWNALGVAYHRKGDERKAANAFEQSFELEPRNPYVLRNLGGLLAADDPERGLPYLQKAAELLPEDQQALYGYALCLTKLDRLGEADEFFQKAITISPHTRIAELCRTEQTMIAAKGLRRATGGMLRMDAVMYCLSAMEIFAQQGPAARQRITFEIALLGRSGLDVNDPTPKYTLSSLAGNFTGLQLVSYMYAGFQEIDPGMDVGVDLSEEFEAAKGLFGKRK